MKETCLQNNGQSAAASKLYAEAAAQRLLLQAGDLKTVTACLPSEYDSAERLYISTLLNSVSTCNGKSCAEIGCASDLAKCFSISGPIRITIPLV